MGKKSKRKKKITRHHLRNRCKNGGDEPENLLKLKNERHQMWHIVFKNLSFIQAAKLLIRTHNMKKGTHFKLIEEE